jgi:SAM-dependent methyltransferase
MRTLASSVGRSFDVVIAFDNSLAHLISDDELLAAFGEFLTVLRPGGIFLCSVRDYDQSPRGEPMTHNYGSRQHNGQVFWLSQEWLWSSRTHYQGSIFIDRQTDSGPVRELTITTEFYAVSVVRLLELLADAGFASCCRIDERFYQPILVARKG